MALKTLKPSVRTLNTATASNTLVGKRLDGNSLYALMRRFERDRPRVCAECMRAGLVGFGDELDHIMPLCMGGSNSALNLQWLCTHHHALKTASEAGNRASGLV